MAKIFKKLVIPCLAVCLAAFIGIMFAACSDGNDGEDKNTDDSAKTYTVTFDLQESVIGDDNLTIQNKPEAQTVKENEYATEPAQPVAYWSFGGWYKEAACTNEFDFESEKITANTTVYAKWTAPTAPSWAFSGVKHFYMTGYTGTVGGDDPQAYSPDNKWEYTNEHEDPPVTITYTYNKIDIKAGESVCVMWHLDGVVADTTYKFDIRLGDSYKQDANVRAGLNIWTQNLEGNDPAYVEVEQGLARKFGLIGLQVEFTEDQLATLTNGATMYKLILQNPTGMDFNDLRIVCAVGDAH